MKWILDALNIDKIWKESLWLMRLQIFSCRCAAFTVGVSALHCLQGDGNKRNIFWPNDDLAAVRSLFAWFLTLWFGLSEMLMPRSPSPDLLLLRWVAGKPWEDGVVVIQDTLYQSEINRSAGEFLIASVAVTPRPVWQNSNFWVLFICLALVVGA